MNRVLDLIEKGIYHREVLPTLAIESVADVVAIRDWNTSFVRIIWIMIYNYIIPRIIKICINVYNR